MGAFASERSISDNILPVQEILHSMSYSAKGKLLMCLKVDMESANDHMSWDFVELVLKNLFPRTIFSRVVGCVGELSFTILINGSLIEWSSLTMSLHQKCPLSPYLFVLNSEVLF